MVDSSLIPTKHLNLPTDFYADPKRLKQLAVFFRPGHILPRCGELIYKTLLRANAIQYLFKFHVPQPTCVFCDSNESYHHFLFTCWYGTSVWQYFKKMQQVLGCPFPRNELELSFELPKPPDGYYVRCTKFGSNPPIARSVPTCLPPKTPLETAINAVSLIKMHLTTLLRDLPLKKGYTKVFNVLRALSDDAWLKAHLVPPVVNT
ncbi:hypothetical protein H310_00994 [Aphanomyces invadans]|uniref:Reverse transcriptase zinc-binding domain-containing protein n=1 Tax=Aphanomyces invadans TaxID=157072 RepID=A0A024UQ71_9STRA|nr:hypothetical protein H310_00994 [Aphanomyces invadans]ETW08409.1 hypothetical protein H310_00994 [Aphanomyces invadans]|eukprot:XP_008862214.1 hypothetical protein H310_00994 [Aphanomyces invadans]